MIIVKVFPIFPFPFDDYLIGFFSLEENVLVVLVDFDFNKINQESEIQINCAQVCV